jgi:hypothetical protein
MILLKCNNTKVQGKYHIDFFFSNTFIRLMHEYNKFIIKQYLQSY